MTDGAAARTIADLVRIHARQRPGAIAFREEDVALSYGEMHEAACQIVGRWSGHGIVAGDRIAYLGRNSLAYVKLLLGAAISGTVMVPLNWRLARAEIAGMLSDADPRMIFVEEDLLDRVAAGDDRIVVVPIEPDGLAAWHGHGEPGGGQTEVRPDQPLLQLYTSGTTGRPKGVMLSHDNLLAQRIRNHAERVEWDVWDADDVSLISMPVAHISGSGWSIYSLFAGVSGIILRDFEPLRVLDLIRNEKITRMFIVPAALRMLAQAAAGQDVSCPSLRYILYGGAPIEQPTLRAVRQQFECGLVQLYGMTESSGAASALGPVDHEEGNPVILESAGRPLPGVDIAILNAQGARLGPGQAGEIAIRGSGVMLGYWRNPEATAAAIDCRHVRCRRLSSHP